MTAARFSVTAFAAAMIATASIVGVAPQPAFAKTVDIAVIVNNVPITNDDIAKRRNLLRLMGTKGNLNEKAREAMIDQALKQSEIALRNMSVTQPEVDASFANFAKSNGMSVAQMSNILNQAGVGVDHFKFYIAVSMSWGQLLRARYGGSTLLPDDEFIAQLEEAEKEGKKPETTEYLLKRIVFVVPEKERGSLLAKRKREAESARSKFPGCDQAISFAATMNDVTVLDYGRFLEPQLPAEWKDAVSKATGNTTSVKTTPYGAEFLAICERETTSDDYAARLVLSAKEDSADADTESESERYMEELKSKAQIVTPGKS
ncbi:peptidylprolyl isomerase [Martelella mangrovi]|uniref:Peptidyl-prolyl cis-trans isomerase SurA n=1 Tax=Martelella mangrovi TaxID=1397477 RepID=A0ABV2IFP0_9HYPH|nr:peptidylprolyl isomerase [uncultured Martelella sp.]